MTIHPAQMQPAHPPPYERAVPGANALAVAGAVDLAFDLTRSPRHVLGAIQGLDKDSLNDFLTITSNLLRAGIVGREILDVDGRPRETFTSARMADPALRGAPPYRRARLDVRA